MKHRRIISLLSAALLGVSAAAFPPAALEPVSIVADAASVPTFTSGDFEFYYFQGKDYVTLKEYLGYSTAVTIPSQVTVPSQVDPQGGTKSVRKIGKRAFCPKVNGVYTPKNLTSVTIPNSVTTIEEYAFAGTPLKKIVFPSGMEKVNQYAFYDCSALKTAETKSVVQFGISCFEGCSAMTHVKFNQGCKAAQRCFNSCTSLYAVNKCSAVDTDALTYTTDENGVTMPILTTNTIARQIIRDCFAGSTQVKFVDEYCSKLCAYIVNTQTKSWMSDAVKARQLHDWLVRHCNYEDGFDPNGNYTELTIDTNNHIYSSVFLSYGLNVRGPGIGETVCDGFARAYTMLLTQANIKSYVLEADSTTNDGHVWNLVRVGTQWYQVDVCFDDGTASDGSVNAVPGYGGFLKSDADMHSFHLSHGYDFLPPAIKNLTSQGCFSGANHPLLLRFFQNSSATAALQACSAASQQDINGDGLLDHDWDFNGTVDWDDCLIYSKICAVCNVPYMGIENQTNFLNNLLIWKKSPSQWRDQA